ncbi:hypothetical protein ACIQJT_41435 [Streptomyces sp. NPDC091972]|uniref:hypothetical protein n=1 Tax=Streptomyces sp. NPDC091972 TaxID=3366007 RepID=UPI0038025A8D
MAYTNLKVFRAAHGDPQEWEPGVFEDYLENCDAYLANLCDWVERFPHLVDQQSAANPDVARAHKVNDATRAHQVIGGQS